MRYLRAMAATRAKSAKSGKRRIGRPPVTDRPITWPKWRQGSRRNYRTDPVTTIERDQVAMFVLHQDQPITPPQERALARTLRRPPAVVKELITDARVTLAKQARGYVEAHLHATRKALARGTPAALKVAVDSSQWALDRIALDGSRVLDPPLAEARRPLVIVGIQTGSSHANTSTKGVEFAQAILSAAHTDSRNP